VKAPRPACRGGLFSRAHGPDDTTTRARYLSPGGLGLGEASILSTGIPPSSEEDYRIHRRDGRTRVLSATAMGSRLWRGGRKAGPANAKPVSFQWPLAIAGILGLLGTFVLLGHWVDGGGTLRAFGLGAGRAILIWPIATAESASGPTAKSPSIRQR
jgi:hypothetical protein